MEGLERLVRSEQASRFFQLANFYRFQTDAFSCGPTSASIVLNALRYGASAPESGPGIRAYTPENVLNARTEKIKPIEAILGSHDPGLNLEQLRAILAEVHGLAVEKHVAETATRNTQREILIDALRHPNQHVIVNFAWTNTGHFSPLTAYDPISRSVLLLDTNPSREKWSWVELDSLFALMETRDKEENRGFLCVEENHR